eukprot:593498_1
MLLCFVIFHNHASYSNAIILTHSNTNKHIQQQTVIQCPALHYQAFCLHFTDALIISLLKQQLRIGLHHSLQLRDFLKCISLDTGSTFFGFDHKFNHHSLGFAQYRAKRI